MNTQNDNSYTAYIGIDWALFQFASIVHFSRVCNTSGTAGYAETGVMH